MVTTSREKEHHLTRLARSSQVRLPLVLHFSFTVFFFKLGSISYAAGTGTVSGYIIKFVILVRINGMQVAPLVDKPCAKPAGAHVRSSTSGRPTAKVQPRGSSSSFSSSSSSASSFKILLLLLATQTCGEQRGPHLIGLAMEIVRSARAVNCISLFVQPLRSYTSCLARHVRLALRLAAATTKR